VAHTLLSAFFEEVVREEKVWTIQDSEGIPAPVGSKGVRSTDHPCTIEPRPVRYSDPKRQTPGLAIESARAAHRRPLLSLPAAHCLRTQHRGVSSQKGSQALPSKRNGIIRSVLWVAFLAVLAWLVVANGGLSFWPSVALFTVYTAGIAIPLGLTLGLLIPWGLAIRREIDELARSPHSRPPT
jgi:hypothetical protein